MLYKILRKGRIIIAFFMFILTFLLFVDFYELFSTRFYDSVLYLQFVPSLLSFIRLLSLFTAGGFLVILLLTLLTGRLYCSVICPLGILQDVINRLARWKSKKKRFFKFKKAYTSLRYIFLAIMVLSVIFGIGWIFTWLDPYSIAGRFFTYVLKPPVAFLNNQAVSLFTNLNIYFLKHQNLPVPSFLPLILTFILTGAIGYFAWKRGRLFCNTICPVGTLLGMVSKYSILKIRFNKNYCTRCGKCAGVCKSECIDIKNYQIDYSRCVSCFNCLDICPEAALSLRTGKANSQVPETDIVGEKINLQNRRKLVVAGLVLLASKQIFALKKNKMPENKQNLILNKKDYPVSPPGSVSIDRFNSVCTGCSLCISACPTHVLQPALTEYGLRGFMQPHMDYLTSFCNYDCTRCGEVCPTSAILPLTLEEKHVTQMGKVVFVKENCIVYTDEKDCGACSEHCPTKAVNMVPYKNGLMIPETNPDICIGCGACEHPCPVEAPFKAIYVNGSAVQQIAKKPEEKEKSVIKVEEDFPF